VLGQSLRTIRVLKDPCPYLHYLPVRCEKFSTQFYNIPYPTLFLNTFRQKLPLFLAAVLRFPFFLRARSACCERMGSTGCRRCAGFFPGRKRKEGAPIVSCMDAIIAARDAIWQGHVSLSFSLKIFL
jgi:hypothetical protein